MTTTTTGLRAVHRHLRRRWAHRGQRGDVPGWVLITVMTLSIGMTLWGIAKPQLVRVLETALNAVQ